MNKKTKKNIEDWVISLIILAIVISIIGIIVNFTIPKPPLTTYILSKFYPLTGYTSGNTKVLFYTKTSPVGCISYAIVKNYAYNVTKQGIYLVNETKITNTTAVEKLYNTVGNSDLVGNQQELFMTENGTKENYFGITEAYVIILQNQTLLCK